VLPLAHHTYHYYLVAPLAGAALAVAALADAARERLPRAARRAFPAAAGALAVALVANAAAIVHRVETMPFADPELRADATVDRARIAANAIGDLRAAALPAGAELRFWSPAAIGRERDAGEDARVESYWEANVRAALADGLAVRVFFPRVGSVRFVRSFEPADDGVRWAVFQPNGHLHVAGSAELAAVLRDLAPGLAGR